MGDVDANVEDWDTGAAAAAAAGGALSAGGLVYVYRRNIRRNNDDDDDDDDDEEDEEEASARTNRSRRVLRWPSWATDGPNPWIPTLERSTIFTVKEELPRGTEKKQPSKYFTYEFGNFPVTILIIILF